MIVRAIVRAIVGDERQGQEHCLEPLAPKVNWQRSGLRASVVEQILLRLHSR